MPGSGPGLNLESKQRRPAFRPPKRMVAGMQGNQRKRIERIGNGTRSANMIKVSMGKPQVTDPPVTILRRGKDDLPIPGRVDDRCFQGFIIRHQVGVGLYRSEGENNDLNHGSLIRQSGCGEIIQRRRCLSCNRSWSKSPTDENTYQDGNEGNGIDHLRVLAVDQSRNRRGQDDWQDIYGFGHAISQTHLRAMDQVAHHGRDQHTGHAEAAQQEIAHGIPVKTGSTPDEQGKESDSHLANDVSQP